MTESPPYTPQSGADILARIKPRLREESTWICLRPDLLDEWERLDEELTETRQANAARPGRMTDKANPDEVKIAERIQAIEAEIEETQLRVTFRAMPKDEWQALCESHPPRKELTTDLYAGYNVDATEDSAVRECMIDPVFADCPIVAKGEPCAHIDCGSWQAFVKVLNPGEWNELRATVRSVNRGVTEAPKSRRAASVLSSRADASEPPSSGAPAQDASTDESPENSTSS
jgi:hypothetical protein